MRSEKPINASPRLSEVSTTLYLKQFKCSSDWRWPSLVRSQGRSSNSFSFHASLLQAIDAVMSLALCPQVVSRASQPVYDLYITEWWRHITVFLRLCTHSIALISISSRKELHVIFAGHGGQRLTNPAKCMQPFHSVRISHKPQCGYKLA